MVLLPYTSDEQDRFAELAEIYWACREAYRDLMTETSAKPIPGSRCASDLAELTARKPPVAEDSEGLIVWAVQLYLYAASEHIGSLSALYRANEVLIAPLVLGRAAIENSAHVIWILGSPDDGAEDRLARSFLEAIFGAEEAKKQSGRLRGKDDDEHKERTNHYRWLKKRATESFKEPHQDADGKPLLHGYQLPGPEQLVMQANHLVSQPLTDELMQGTYGFLSNFVHPTFYALEELFNVTEQNGQKIPALNRDLSFHDRLARLVVGPFYHALAYASSYNGWASHRFEQLNEDIVRLLPDTFVAGPSPGPFDQPGRA